MFWIFTAAKRLRSLGVLGMNRRNAACILDHNPRSKYPLVDDKMRLHRLCATIGVPTPAVYAEIRFVRDAAPAERTVERAAAISSSSPTAARRGAASSC